ncbi:MAG: MBL fold metallo-hydrolase [Candidatus Omnitrophica bacterium]|nr:MBL fold metallo-hydrolase [Candidatus Omnitrophota bacterium]
MDNNKSVNCIIKRFVVGPMGVNCYLVADPDTGETCLIDPGADPDAMKSYIKEKGLDLKFIIITHGHGDHIAANGYFNVPIYIHKDDADFLADPAKNLSKYFLFAVTSPKASRLLEDGEVVRLGKLSFTVIHTPGHTPGSISLKLGGSIFTGDTLFCGGVGRTDFAYSDEEALWHSINDKLFREPGGTVIYPGHGESSTIGQEKGSL